jgi:hypothetical protein
MQAVAQELVAILERVSPMLHSLASDQTLATRVDPKKWCRKEILGHLIDSACNNQQKFVRMMQQPRKHDLRQIFPDSGITSAFVNVYRA